MENNRLGKISNKIASINMGVVKEEVKNTAIMSFAALAITLLGLVATDYANHIRFPNTVAICGQSQPATGSFPMIDR